MKIGCCVNMLPSGELPASIDYAKELKAYGYDYIELPMNRIVGLSENDFRIVQEKLSESGLPLLSCNDFMPREMRIVGDETVDEDTLKRFFEKAFSRVGRDGLGTPVAVFGSPWSRECPAGFPKEKAKEQIAAFLRLAAGPAKAHGVRIAVETINRTETNMMNAMKDSEAVVEMAGVPEIGLLCDYYHMRMENEPFSETERLGSHFLHMHIAKKEKRAAFPDLSGEEAEIREFAAVLKRIGYTGGISLEAKLSGEVWREDVRRSLPVLKEVFVN